MSRQWNSENPDKMREANRRFRIAHPERVRELAKTHRANRREKAIVEIRAYAEANKEREAQRRKLYREKHRQQIREAAKIRYATDRNNRMRTILSARMSEVLRGLSKTARTLELVGCSLHEPWAHLEQQFSPAMSWDNYGYYGWHIDHIRPCSSFDLSDPEQQRLCFHYTNLQPLWAKQNMRKGKQYIDKKKHGG